MKFLFYYFSAIYLIINKEKHNSIDIFLFNDEVLVVSNNKDENNELNE